MNRLKACKERLEREKAEARQAQQAKIDRRQAKEEATGKKPRGRTPREVKVNAALAEAKAVNSRFPPAGRSSTG